MFESELSEEENRILEHKKAKLEEFENDLRTEWEQLARALGCTVDQAKKIHAHHVTRDRG